MGSLQEMIETLERDQAIELITQRLSSGENPVAILNDCREGMTRIGELFQEGDYFLAELLLSAEIFKEAAALLSPHLQKEGATDVCGTIILATMRGDVHDLGKNILATLLRAQSFDVHDLGVNVEPTDLLQKVKEIEPDFVGLSALITTSFESSKQAVDMLEEEGLRGKFKLLVGGGVTTNTFKDHIGADFQTHDASAGVEYCIEYMRKAG
ncbi:MAG: cobalamin-binding protein [Halieaceae bacterium]|nr:cobalamin-binding protein [Halieaceae bacterium]